MKRLMITDHIHTPIYLNQADVRVKRFDPSPDQGRYQSRQKYGVDGDIQFIAERTSATEAITLVFSDTENGRSLHRQLNVYLRQAERWNSERQEGWPVYLGIKMGCDDEPCDLDGWWYTEILNGRITWDQGSFDWGWTGFYKQATLSITRDYFWEYEDEVLLATGEISNGVTGCSVNIPASAICGDLASPLRVVYSELYVDNQLGGVAEQAIYTAVNYSIKLPYNPTLQTDVPFDGTLGIVTTPDPNASNGSVGLQTISGDTKEVIASVAIPNSGTNKLIDAIAGRPVSILLRLAGITVPSGASADLRFSIKTVIAGGYGTPNTLWTSQWVSIPREQFVTTTDGPLWNLGVGRIPPNIMGKIGVGGMFGTIYMDIEMRAYDNPTTITTRLDYLKIFPLDSWRYIYPIGVTQPTPLIPPGTYDPTIVTDDMITGQLYSSSAPYIAPNYAAIGEDLEVVPARDHRVFFHTHHYPRNHLFEETFMVSIYHKPRRTTV